MKKKKNAYEIHQEPGIGWGARVKTPDGGQAHLGYHPSQAEARAAVDRHKENEAYWADYAKRHEQVQSEATKAQSQEKKEKPIPGGEPGPVNIWGRF